MLLDSGLAAFIDNTCKSIELVYVTLWQEVEKSKVQPQEHNLSPIFLISRDVVRQTAPLRKAAAQVILKRDVEPGVVLVVGFHLDKMLGVVW